MLDSHVLLTTESRRHLLASQPSWLSDVLACPCCRNRLLTDAHHLDCPECHAVYPVKRGIASLIRPEDGPLVFREERAWQIREKACGRDELSESSLEKSQEPRHRALLEWLREQLRNRGASQILELGAGRGWASRALAEDGHRVVASDILEDDVIGLRQAVRQQHLGGPAFACVKCRAETLPFGDTSFDCVFCFAMLRHIADLERVLREVSRVLKPGGVFLALDEPFRGVLTATPQRLQDCITHRLARTWLVGTLPQTVPPEIALLRDSLGSTLHEAARRVPFCVSLGAAAGLRTRIFPTEIISACPTLAHLLEEPGSLPLSWLDAFAAALELDGERLRASCARNEAELSGELLAYWTNVANFDGVLIAEKESHSRDVQAEAGADVHGYRLLDGTLLDCSRDGIIPIYGVYRAEEERGWRFRWTLPQAGFLVARSDVLELVITCPPKCFRSEPVRVEIRVEDEQAPLLVAVVLAGKTVAVRAPLNGKASSWSSVLVRLSANVGFIPSDYDQRYQDMRVLSLQIGSQRI